MTIVSFLFQRRRLLVLCAATLALHYATIDWVGDRLGSQSRRAAPPQPASLMNAQLRLTLPKRVPSAPAPEVAPLPKTAAAAAKPRPVARGAPVTTPVTAGPEQSASDAATALAAVVAIAAVDVNVEQSGAPPPPVAPAVAEGAPPAAAAPVEAAPSQAMRRYKVNLPPSASFEMAVARVDADGSKWTGAATMTWHTDGGRYKASVEAGVSLLITRLNLLVLRSEGTIDDYGIAPVTATEKRARRSETATHFNRDAGTISFSSSERSYPLLVGAQDKATVPFQLAGIGRADVNQFGGDIDIQVGEEKEATIFRFQLVGEEELDTKLGKLVTWHLTRPPKPGTYSSQLDIWLAPGMNWFPVQIRNTERNGALTTQTVSNITMTESGK
jgi:hypothetical protein